ncbi:hypothetical protein DERP_005121 [Dermatophagoides pteronyssinus]|nr:hypothetical protein DERP_005121 [Dermatophagoides pteronyssinus]
MVEPRLLLSNNGNDINHFIQDFHDAYYSNSAIFDDLMKRYSIFERTNRAMNHFNNNNLDEIIAYQQQQQQQQQNEQQKDLEFSANDITAINRAFFRFNIDNNHQHMPIIR